MRPTPPPKPKTCRGGGHFKPLSEENNPSDAHGGVSGEAGGLGNAGNADNAGTGTPGNAGNAGESGTAGAPGNATNSGEPSSPNSGNSTSGQLTQQVQLNPQPSTNNNAPSASTAGPGTASGQVAGTVPLPTEGAADTITSIVADGLVFEVRADGTSVKLTDASATPPTGDLALPALVTSGTTTYDVVAIGPRAFARCPELTSVSLPAAVREVDTDAFTGCTSLASITVSSTSETFASHDDMLFTKDLSQLLSIPEDKEGAAVIPGRTSTVPASAFSRCPRLSSVRVGDGGAALSTHDGMLFSSDLKTLLVCPPAAGAAVVLPAETESIGTDALAGCKNLASITALGTVREIDPTAFADEAKTSAVVALPAGEDYAARKAVWEKADFQHFAEPAAPGATTRPHANGSDTENPNAASGLAFTLLDDYTLAVAWEGAEDPAAEVEIPTSAEINGVSYRVSTVAANAFANRASLASVKLPATVTSLGEAAFAGCANLASVEFPDGLQVIGERAFEATALTDVWLPASVATIGPRAFAACESLTRVVSLGEPQVAEDALATCTNVSIYCPYNEDGTYPWNLGLLANNNHLLPYGLTLPEEPLQLEVGQQANLFEGGICEAPEGCELSFSYAAAPLSVASDGTAAGKAKGSSEVTVTLFLDGQELARASRPVEVLPAAEMSEIELYGWGGTAEGVHTWRVFFDMNGGSPQLAPVSLDTNASILDSGEYFWMLNNPFAGLIPDPAPRAGYIFDGWYHTDGTKFVTGNSGQHAIKPNVVTQVVTDSGEERWINVTAYWTPITYNVYFAPAGGITSDGYDMTTTQTLTYDKQENLAPNPFSRKGYTFAGWSKTISDPKVEYADKAPVLNLENTQDAVFRLFAVWQANTYNIVYHANYGDNTATTSQSLKYDAASPSLAPNSFQREGWTFDHWTTEAGGTGTSYANGATLARPLAESGEVHLYAQWKKNTYNVTYQTNGGSAIEGLTVEHGTKLIKPGDPSKDGYIFGGWFKEPECQNAWSFENDTVTKNTTLHAKWTQITHEVTFQTSGGSAVEKLTVADGTKLTEPTDPTRAGYTFGGWYKEESYLNAWDFNSDTVTADTTLFAKWSIKEFDLVAPSGQMLHYVVLTHEGREGTVMVSKSSLEPDGPEGNLTIPASVPYDGVTYAVTRVALNGFSRCAGLTSVTFEEGSPSLIIDGVAFAADRALTSVTLPSNLVSIGYSCFANSSSLTYLNIPDKVTTIGQEAFASVFALKTIVLGKSVATLERRLFYGCASLETVIIKGKITPAEPAGVFLGAPADTLRVYVPSAEQKTRWEGFGSGVPNDHIIFQSAFYTVQFHVNDDADTVLEYQVAAGDTVPVPAVPARPGYSVDGWYTEQALVNRWDFATPVQRNLPLYASWSQNVEQGDFIFRMRSDGESLSIAARDPERLTSDVVIPETAEYGGRSYPVKEIALQGFMKASIRSVKFPTALEVIGAQAFKDSTLEDIYFAENGLLKTIGSDAFEATRIKQLCVPASVKQIGRTVFYNCDSLVSVTFEEGSTIKVIEDTTFGYCENLEAVALPDSVTEIYMNAMTFCPKLKTVYLPASLKSIHHNVFSGSTSLESIVLPANLSSIGQFTFADTNLKTLYVQGNVTDIGNSVFSNVPGPIDVYLASPDRKSTWEAYKKAYPNPVLNLHVNGEGGTVLHTVTFDSKGGVPATSTAQVVAGEAVARPADPVKPGQVFEAWYANSELTGEPYDFTQPVTSDFPLYAKYAAYSGTLPTLNNEGEVTWTFNPADGSLSLDVVADGLVTPLWDSLDTTNQGFWGPLRGQVTSVHMDPSLRTQSMRAWFERMPLLTDVTDVFVPEECTDVHNLFYNSDAFTLVSPSFSLPSKVEDATSLFNGARSLEALPSAFTLPSSVKWAGSMFMDTKLATLPENFTLPDSLETATSLFSGCAELTSLPAGFRIPDGKVSKIEVGYMFGNCRKLAALPEGFYVPNNVGSMEGIFYGCTSLTSLPDSFTFPIDQANQGGTSTFYCDAMTKTYFGGPSSSNVVQYANWPQWNREIVTAVPAERAVSFLLPDAEGAFTKTLQKQVAGENGLLIEPTAPVAEGHAFIGWYLDSALTQPFNFAKSITDQEETAPNPVSTLYGRYYRSSDVLPTTRNGVAGTEGAWELTADGVLHLTCAEGSIIDRLYQSEDTYTQGFWGPVRGLVRSVDMDASLRVVSLDYWFAGMTQLTSANGIFVPTGTASLTMLFNDCTSLESLPAGFTVPSGIKSVKGMFRHCTALKTLPEGFALSDTVTTAYAMFGGSGITALPDGFTVPHSTTSVSWMFSGCQNLASLPAGFKLGNKTSQMKYMFSECSALVSLPEEFSVTDAVADCSYMFADCTSLATLPEGFKVPPSASDLVVGGMERMFAGCDALTVLPSSFDFPLDVANKSTEPFMATNPDTLTYFAGPESSAVRSFAWQGQNRKLVVANDPNNPLPEGVHLVTFLTPDEAKPGKWVTYASALTSADGLVVSPKNPSRFGYPFVGWYRDPACMQPFNFGAALSEDATVYGKFGPVLLRYQVPLGVEVSIDAAGTVSKAGLTFASYTPAAVSVSGVTSGYGTGATALLPRPADRDAVKALINLGYEGKLKLDGGTLPLSVSLSAATGYADPGTAQGDFTLDLGNAQVNYSETPIEDVARLQWTVGLG